MLNKNYTEQEKTEIGEELAEIFKMRKGNRDKKTWKTSYGDKTALGVFYTFENLACKIIKGQKI